MSFHLVTGATPDYPWTRAYIESVEKHLNRTINFTVFETRPALRAGEIKTDLRRTEIERPPTLVSLVPCPDNRCKSLQHGEFLKYIPAELDDIFIFTDADMMMQRPFTREELRWIDERTRCMADGRVLIAPNDREDDTLLEEAELLEHHLAGQRHTFMYNRFGCLDGFMPGWRSLPVRNCGVIIATKQTYRRLYDLTSALLPVVETVFPHFAAIQFCICYCVSKFLKLETMPRTLHTHGHFGMPDNCRWGNNGEVYVSHHADELHEKHISAVFRHAMNLYPEKGPIFVPNVSNQPNTKESQQP